MMRTVEYSEMSEHVHLIKRTWRHIPENSNLSYTSNRHVYTGKVPLHKKRLPFVCLSLCILGARVRCSYDEGQKFA